MQQQYQPYATSGLTPALTLAAAALSGHITERFVPKQFIVIDLSNKEDPKTKAIMSRIADKDGHIMALGSGPDQGQQYFPAVPMTLVFAYGTSASNDRAAIEASIGNPQTNNETSVEIYGDFVDDPDLPDDERPNADTMARKRILVYAGQWNFASGQKDPNILPSVRRQILALAGTGVGTPRDRPTSEEAGGVEDSNDQSVNAPDSSEQTSTRNGLLDIIRNLMQNMVPEDMKEDNAAFWANWTKHVRMSRSIQDDLRAEARGEYDHLKSDLTAHSAPAASPDAPIGQIVSHLAAATPPAPETLDEALS